MPGSQPTLRTSRPCAVTTSGAPPASARDQPGRDEEVRVHDVGLEAPRGRAASRGRARGTCRLPPPPPVEHRALDLVAARDELPPRARARTRRGRDRRARDTSGRRAGSSSADRLRAVSDPARSFTSPSLRRSSRCPSARRALRAAAKSLVRRKTRDVHAVDGISFDIARARSSASSARTAPARRRP